MCKVRNEKWSVYSFDYLLVILLQILITTGILITFNYKWQIYGLSKPSDQNLEISNAINVSCTKRHYQINYAHFHTKLYLSCTRKVKPGDLVKFQDTLTSSNFTQQPPVASIFFENKSHDKKHRSSTFFQISRKDIKRRTHDF